MTSPVLSAYLHAHLADPDRFQQLTDEDKAQYGSPGLEMLAPPLTGDADCDRKRGNWIDWRAAPYSAKRHSEYLFEPEKDLGGQHARILISAVMPTPVDMDAYLAGIHRDRRYTVRGKKAENRGYRARGIAPAEHGDEIYEIIHSSKDRQGRPIAEMFDARPRTWRFPDYMAFSHPEYRDICVGVFDPEGVLVAYLLGKRVGHHVQYDEIMGHAEHVGNDVMYLLHFYFLQQCAEQEVVPVCLNYGPWYSGENPYSAMGGLNHWKRRIGFRPAYLILASS